MRTVENGLQGWTGVLAVVLASGLVACGGGTPSVSFVTPADGATVSSPVAMEFMASNLNISPVPEEVETPREGIGHHHVAIDTECLPVGEAIPRADPWVHFGDGSETYETLLPAGQYMLTLQIGDDEHRTQEGLCTTISITVE
ncbi:MAG TPA: DUF4399 domain-containing protein [Acidobacteria bacterium]|nr:DUF4399 domain-containing protein [Acidobacteriota bacterium]